MLKQLREAQESQGQPQEIGLPINQAVEPGQHVRVLGCPTHQGLIGVVLEVWPVGIRVEFDDKSRCWPMAYELVEGQQKTTPPESGDRLGE